MNFRWLEHTLRGDLITPHVVRACASLGIFGLLRDHEYTSEDVARQLALDPGFVRTVLEYLEVFQVTECGADGLWRVSPIAAHLLTPERVEVLGSNRLAAAINASGASVAQSLQTGVPAFRITHGHDFWAYLRDNELIDDLHDDLESFSPSLARSLFQHLSWGEGCHVVDIGGGRGLLSTLLASYLPSCQFMILDREIDIDESGRTFAAAGVHNVQARAGDFFDGLPDDGDVYLVCQVLHDWPDAEVLRLLTSVRSTMKADARLLIVERDLSSTSHRQFNADMSLRMMVLFGSSERSEDAYISLAQPVGFTLIDRHELSRGFMALEFGATDPACSGATA